MIDDHHSSLEAEVATLREKVRAIEESENSAVRRFIGKVEQNNAEIQSLREAQMEIKTVLDGHINWSSQIPLNYERLHKNVEALEKTVREGFSDLSQKFNGQDKDFNYFVRIPAKTVLLGILGVFGLAFGHSIVRFVHLLWNWVSSSMEIRIPK